MKMKKFAIANTILAVIGIVCSLTGLSMVELWTGFGSDITIVGTFVALISVPLAIVSWIIILVKKIKKTETNVPITVVIAATSAVLMVISFVWGMYDMATDTGYFAGLTGALLVMFAVPFFAIIFAVDMVVILVMKYKKR